MQREKFVVMTPGDDGRLWGRSRIVGSRVEAVRLVDEVRAGRPLDPNTRAQIVAFLDGGPLTDGCRWISSYGPEVDRGDFTIYGCILPITG